MRFYEFDRGRSWLMDRISRTTARNPAQVHRFSVAEPFLYHGTIASNIRMYHEELTDEEIRKAAAFVDVGRLYWGSTWWLWSSSNRARVYLINWSASASGFARTIAAQPKIPHFDEATANIDQETEEMIQNSLKKMRQGRTTIAIAHRLSTIQDADCIHVLDKGKIIESGNHDQLIALGGTYKKM